MGVEFLLFNMSTSTAMPPSAIANNLGIGTRQTGAGDVDDIKIDERGWQAPPPGEWTVVSTKGRKRASTPPPPARSRKTREWKPRPVQGPNLPTHSEKKVLIAEKREAARVAAFRASVARIALPARETMQSQPETPFSAPAPSKTRTQHALRRIKDKKRASPKRSPSAQASRAAANFIRSVTKEEASAPVVPAIIELSNTFAPLDEPGRGTGAVVVLKSPGSTHIDNFAGRTMCVRSKGYEVVSAKFVGFFKSTLGSSFTPASIGFHIAGDAQIVHLPEGLVETLGAYLVGKVPNMETYLSCQAYCRSLCRPIDFETPRLMEDAAIYGPYLAMISRSGEREAIIRKLQGTVYTRAAMKCLKIGALGGLALSMPVATAATAAGAPVALAGGLAFSACAAVAVGTALAVRAGLSYFKADERIVVRHAPLPSVNSRAVAPAQHPDAKIKRLQLEKKAPDAIRPDAARVTGIAVAGHAPTVFAKNQDNTVAALRKRSAVLPAPFHSADREEFVSWFLKHWPHMVAQWMRLDVPSDPDEWLEHVLLWIRGSNASPSAKETYEKTARALRELGITSHSALTPRQVYDWTKREASVKNETVLKSDDKSPRQILAATPEFVVLTAPFIKDLTGLVRRKWKPSNKYVYAPGVSSKKLAEAVSEFEWDNIANLDFDGYDSSQGIHIGEMERRICELHSAPMAMLQLMRGNFETHGVSREGVKFETPYVRNSGDPWTTLFNSVLNVALLTYVMCRVRECDPRDLDAKIFAGGDDGVQMYNGPRIDLTGELKRLGFPATVKHVSALHEVEFLSCRLTHTTTGWNFVPMVGKTIGKLGYSVRAETPHRAKQIARGAAMSLYAASSGCPPLRAYLDAVLRVTEGVKALHPRDEPWKMSSQHTGEPTSETWAHLGDIYGWSQSLQDTLVARLATVKEAGTVIDSPALALLCDRDTGREPEFPRMSEIDPTPTPPPSPAPPVDLTMQGIEPNPGPTIVEVVPRAQRRPGRRRPAAVRRRAPTTQLVVRPPRTIRPRRGRRVTAAGANTITSGMRGLTVTAEPAAYDYGMSSSYMTESSNVMRNVDQDWMGGKRLSGRCMFTISAQAYTDTADDSPHGLLATSTVPGRAFFNVTPGSLNSRLAAIASGYQYQAVRLLKVCYLPTKGADTDGDIFMAISTDPSSAAANFNKMGQSTGNTAGTVANMLDFESSATQSIRKMCCVSAVHRATKLWPVVSDGEPTNEQIQFSLLVAGDSLSTTLTAATLVKYGTLWVDYVIDFYKPGPPLGTVQ